MRSAFRSLRLAAVAVGCATLAACSSGRYEPIPETGATLEGTVTYAGQTLHAGMVIVAGPGGGGQGAIGEDGRYVVKNAPVGEVSIGVTTAAAKGEMMGRAMAQKSKTPPKIVDVPAKYTDPLKSGIKTTVNKGANTFDVVLPK